MSSNIFANTKKQLLAQHLFAVGYLSYQIVMHFYQDETLAIATCMAGFLHDVGKLDPGFQSWLLGELKKNSIQEVPEEGQHIDSISGKFSFEEHPRHNEISLLLYHLLNDETYKIINRENKDRIKHVLYWHHAKPVRKKEFTSLETIQYKLEKSLGKNGLDNLTHAVGCLVKDVNKISENYRQTNQQASPLAINGLLETVDDDSLYGLDQIRIPKYKKYSAAGGLSQYIKDILFNAKNDICRASVISADRLVSSLDSEMLDKHITESSLDALLKESLILNSNLEHEIQCCLKGFDERSPDNIRNHAQKIAAKRLNEVEQVAILKGPAGCGKTKIALEWALNTQAQKIIWVCPRVQVCQSLLKDLSSSEYLPDTKIEICTGEFKSITQQGKTVATSDNYLFSGDIVITTIDQIINTITTHTHVTGLLQFLTSHVVFDEFHEYISMPAFNLLFAELVKAKDLQGSKANTLLVSATPNPFFIEEFLEIDRDHIIGIDSFNQSRYKITFQSFNESQLDESNPLYQKQPPETIVISNTAKTAQLSFIQNQKSEKGILFHSKYTKQDKQLLFEQIYESFKHKGSRQFDVLRSGPVIQASLNITCSRMITELTNAENCLQRLGRLDRFGENQEFNEFIVAIPELFECRKTNYSKLAKFLSYQHILESTSAWNIFLQSKLTNHQIVSIQQLYALYDKFYQDEFSLNSIERDLMKSLAASVEILEKKLLDPVDFPQKKKSLKNKIKKHSLRGDNRFVQMAICQIESLGVYDYLEQYAYDDDDLDANLTLSVELIQGYGSSDKNLLSHMVKKHHNIKNMPKAYKDVLLLNEARSPDTPIYSSYIPNDLKKVGGESARHPYAIYYAIGRKQAIGAMSISNLNQSEEN